MSARNIRRTNVIIGKLQQIKEIKVNDETKTGQFLKKSLWYVSISRNALIVMITSIIGYNWTSSHSPPFKLSGS